VLFNNLTNEEEDKVIISRQTTACIWNKRALQDTQEVQGGIAEKTQGASDFAGWRAIFPPSSHPASKTPHSQCSSDRVRSSRLARLRVSSSHTQRTFRRPWPFLISY